MPDEIDFKLIRELQQDSRQKNTILAQKLGLSEPTVRRRVANLIRKEMVKFTVILNPEKLGFPVSANISFGVEPSKIDQVADQIAAIDFFYAVSVVAGAYDVIASGYFKSLEHIYELIGNEIGKIEGINRINTMIILKRRKRAY
jgi:Lrp/AsnC family transcriptional regulator for asnA, asnC and gidA